MKVFSSDSQYKIVTSKNVTIILQKGQGYQTFDPQTGVITFFLEDGVRLASEKASEIQDENGDVYAATNEEALALIQTAIQPVTPSLGTVTIDNFPSTYALPTPQQTILEKIRDKNELIFEVQSTGALAGKTAQIYHVLGRRGAFVNSTDQHDVCNFLTNAAGQQNYPEIATGDSFQIVSTSGSDSSAGVGARTVNLLYINAAGAIAIHTATMNGTTAVPVLGVDAIKKVLWLEVATAGTSKQNVGAISLQRITGSIVHEQIAAGDNKSLSARFSVPTGYTAYLLDFDVFAIAQNQDVRLKADVDSFTRQKIANDVYTTQDTCFCASNTNIEITLPFLKFGEGVDIKASTISGNTTGTPRCDVSFTLLLIQN